MALICCLHCGHRHSELRSICPQCGLRDGQSLGQLSSRLGLSQPPFVSRPEVSCEQDHRVV